MTSTMGDKTVSATMADELVGAVRAAVAQAKDGDPMAPVRVLVPSNLAGQSLSRRFGRSGGAVNLHFMKASRLAAAIVPRSVEPRRRLTADLKRELARLVALEARSPLDVHSPVGLIQPMVQVFDELRKRTDFEVDELAAANPMSAELVRLYHRYRLAASLYQDDRDVIEAATASVDGTTIPVVAVLDRPPTPSLNALLQALHDTNRLHVVLVCCGDETLDQSLRQSLWFTPQVSLPPGGLVVADKIRLAPDADTEVQLAVARFLERAEDGVPFHRMALLFGSPAPYALVAQQELSATGIPWRGQPAAKLDQSVAGRFISGLLTVYDSDFSRSSVVEWMTSTPIRDTGGELIPAEAWAALARRARVQFGAHSWQTRLTALADELKDSKYARERELVAHVAALASFVQRLADEGPPDESSWDVYVDWLQGRVISMLGTTPERDQWVSVEAQAAEDTVARLERLRRLGTITQAVDLDTFAAAVGDQLSNLQRLKSTSTGVFVGTLSEAAVCDFDFAVVLGVAEGSLPARSGEGLISALQVPGDEARAEQSKRDFLMTLSGCDVVELSCPLVDRRSQRPARPSPWLLAQAGSLAGGYVSAEQLTAAPLSTPWLETVQSFTAAIRFGTVGISDRFDRLLELQSGSAGHDLEKSFALVAKRRSGDLTDADGYVATHSALSFTPARPVSPTSLEDWAICPFRYFLKSVLRVGDRDGDHDEFKLDPRDRGSLVHQVLEHFIKAHAGKASNESWSDEERTRLHAAGDQAFDRATETGKVPTGLLWEAERDAMHLHLDGFLDRDQDIRREFRLGTAAEDIELSFGEQGQPPVTVGRPSGVPIAFRGRIDRVDRSEDGTRIFAFDYKTGSSEKAKYKTLGKDCVSGGSALQLAVYAEAVRQMAGQSATVTAGYWFLTDAVRRYPLLYVQGDETNTERWRDVLTKLADGVEGGVFPLVPGDPDRGSYENCRYCPYDDLCPSDRNEAWQRKSLSAEYQPFDELAITEDDSL